MVEEVKALSTFRDEHLLTNRTGQSLVKFYYAYSPKVADFIRDKESLKAMVRAGLKPLVWAANKSIREYENTEIRKYGHTKIRINLFPYQHISHKRINV